MNSQTLKRQADDVSFKNDDLDDDKYDITWGNKKSRYIYTNLQSPDLFPNIDSDQTKSTIEETDEHDLEVSTQSSCGSDCDCNSQNSSHLDHTEFEVTKKSLSLGIDNGYSPDDTDSQDTILKKNLPSACFKKCSRCKKENTNPYYQFCDDCFKYRIQLFESNPNSKPKSIKRLTKVSNYTQGKSGLCKDSHELCSSNLQEPYTSYSQESGSFGISCMSLKSKIDVSENSLNLCSVCLLKPKNGLFNHGHTSHLYCCYTCSKQIWVKSGKCPICNSKVRYVTKLNIVN